MVSRVYWYWYYFQHTSNNNQEDDINYHAWRDFTHSKRCMLWKILCIALVLFLISHHKLYCPSVQYILYMSLYDTLKCQSRLTVVPSTQIIAVIGSRADHGISLHEDPTFSIHSLAHTGSSCLLRCHDYIATCAIARALKVWAFIISCLRPRHIQHPFYYYAFI